METKYSNDSPTNSDEESTLEIEIEPEDVDSTDKYTKKIKIKEVLPFFKFTDLSILRNFLILAFFRLI
jgi:hypothetical protein